MTIDHLYVSDKLYIRDPVHGYIIIDKGKFEFLRNVIDSFEFQRLRRIKQLGTTYLVFPGADHSRFGHSLGTMWLICQLGNKFMNDGVEIDEDLMSQLLLATLIHDIGHGPFSHVFERVTSYDHKDMTLQFIEKKLPEMVETFSCGEIKRILGKDLDPKDAWIGDLLDSQIDVDRMDFLLRDSLYTGVDYGRFDFQRVFHSLAVGGIEGENRLVLLLKGLHAFEGFFIAYHHMYWQVYFHKTTRACEILLGKIISRMKEIREKIDIEIAPELNILLAEEKLDLLEFFSLDDCTILEAIKKCCSSRDDILRDLCSRFLRREVFKCVKKEKIENIDNIFEISDKVRKFYERRNISYDYYFANDDPKKVSVERPVLEKGLMMVDIDKFGVLSDIFDFIDESKIIRPLYNIKHAELRIYCPEFLANDLKEILSTI